MKIISDINAYKTIVRVRGIADVRKPNTRRPIFRRVKVHIPLAYLVKLTNTIIAHPSIVDALKKHAQIDNAPMMQDYSPLPSLFQPPVFEPPAPDEDPLNFRFRYGFGVGTWPSPFGGSSS